MPYYHDVLASAWPDFVHDVGAPPAQIDPQFMATLTPWEFGFFGPNKRGLLRNQVEGGRSAGRAGLQVPKFLSEKPKTKSATGSSSVEEEVDKFSNSLHAMEIDSSKTEVPLKYRALEIKYSRFGVDDFDFG